MKNQQHPFLIEAIERTVEKYDHEYSFTRHPKGFKLYFCQHPFHFDFKNEKVGWTVALVSKPHDKKGSYQDIIHMYEEFIPLIHQFNNKNKADLTNEKSHLVKHLEEIDQFFYSLKDLLASKHQTDQTVVYSFKITGDQLVQPMASIHYIESEQCWKMNVFGFSQGAQIIPPFDAIYQKGQQLLFRLNTELQ
ncbi:hypothetical protein [Lacticigenium naphthae]|uniref:hypothetical protein n=1 Tax=Lacticigenium naphthae TaxID=515351 RepID=UPI000413309B|nr:hypothetical protein [Lacticigenium naphthae]